MTATTLKDTVIVDIDGTLRDWDGSIVEKGMAFAQRHHDLGHVLAIASLRDDVSARAWLADSFPLPFIGPFCRPAGDQRGGPVFKYDVACALLREGYNVVGAVDNDPMTCWMWHRWARWYNRKHTSPAEFDLVKTSFSPR